MYTQNFKKRRILVFGDSNTHGFDPMTEGRYGDDERYPRLLETLLGPGSTVLEEGLSGRTAVFDDPLFEGLRGLDAIYSCMMSHEPLDLVIIMLGTNDTKERFCCNARQIAVGLQRLVYKALSIQAWRDTPDVLLVCPPTIVPEYYERMFAGEMGAGCAEKSAGLYAALEAVFAGDAGAHVRLLDAGKLAGVAMSERDGMHLTREAHAALAKGLADFLQTEPSAPHR